MKSHYTLNIFLVILGSLIPLSGCKPTGATSSSSGKSIGWLTGVGENLVPGIDSGNVQHQKVGNTDILVVWIDSNRVSSSSTDTGGDPKHSGKIFFTGDTRRLPDLVWQSDDKGSGTVTCGKSEYNLKEGNLFLVSTTGSEPIVKQLKRDVSKLTTTREGIRAFADGDDELRKFFTTLAPSKTETDKSPNTSGIEEKE